MKPAQKTQLELVFKEVRYFNENQVLWTFDQDPDYALLIQKGSFTLHRDGGRLKDVCSCGYYIGEVDTMLKGLKNRTKLVCIEDGSAFSTEH